MTGKWVAAAVAVGQWVLFMAGGIFVLILVALVIYAIRKGERDNSEVRPPCNRTAAQAGEVGKKNSVE